MATPTHPSQVFPNLAHPCRPILPEPCPNPSHALQHPAPVTALEPCPALPPLSGQGKVPADPAHPAGNNQPNTPNHHHQPTGKIGKG